MMQKLDAVHLVEVSPTLRHVQHAARAGAGMGPGAGAGAGRAPVDAAEIAHARTVDGLDVHWHARLADVPQGRLAIRTDARPGGALELTGRGPGARMRISHRAGRRDRARVPGRPARASVPGRVRGGVSRASGGH